MCGRKIFACRHFLPSLCVSSRSRKCFALLQISMGRKKKKNYAVKTDLTTWVCGGVSPLLSMDWRLETIFTFIQENDKHKHLQISSSSTNSACWCKILYYDFIYFHSRCDGIWVVVAESGIKALTSSSPYEIIKRGASTYKLKKWAFLKKTAFFLT